MDVHTVYTGAPQSIVVGRSYGLDGSGPTQLDLRPGSGNLIDQIANHQVAVVTDAAATDPSIAGGDEHGPLFDLANQNRVLQGHAYWVKSYDPATDRLQLANPHGPGPNDTPKPMTWATFSKIFPTVYTTVPPPVPGIG